MVGVEIPEIFIIIKGAKVDVEFNVLKQLNNNDNHCNFIPALALDQSKHWTYFTARPFLVINQTTSSLAHHLITLLPPPQHAQRVVFCRDNILRPHLQTALHHAHASHIAHNDIRPQNIGVYSPAGHAPVVVVILQDWGLASKLGDPFHRHRGDCWCYYHDTIVVLAYAVT